MTFKGFMCIALICHMYITSICHMYISSMCFMDNMSLEIYGYCLFFFSSVLIANKKRSGNTRDGV